MTEQDKERLAETVIQKEIGIKSGTSLLTPMDYGECVRCIMVALSTERAQQELQAYRDIIKELLPFAIKAQYSTSIHNEKGREDVRIILSTIERARKLIDTETPT